MIALSDYQKQLHIIYLSNDILFKALSTRPEGSGPDAGAASCACRLCPHCWPPTACANQLGSWVRVG